MDSDSEKNPDTSYPLLSAMAILGPDHSILSLIGMYMLISVVLVIVVALDTIPLFISILLTALEVSTMRRRKAILDSIQDDGPFFTYYRENFRVKDDTFLIMLLVLFIISMAIVCLILKTVTV